MDLRRVSRPTSRPPDDASVRFEPGARHVAAAGAPSYVAASSAGDTLSALGGHRAHPSAHTPETHSLVERVQELEEQLSLARTTIHEREGDLRNAQNALGAMSGVMTAQTKELEKARERFEARETELEAAKVALAKSQGDAVKLQAEHDAAIIKLQMVSALETGVDA